MTWTVRSVATSLAVGFAMYFAARGLWWIEQPTAPLLMIVAIGLYLVVVYVAILWDSAASVRMPMWVGVAAVASSVLIPVLVTRSLHPASLTAPFATWYIGALGLLGIVCVVRRRFVAGWLVVLVLVVASSAFLGLVKSLALGLVGSFMWVVIAHLLVMFWDRAVRDTERLAGIQQAVSAWHATQQVRQKERRLRTQFALAVAGPVLSRAVSARGALNDRERLRARLAEGRLRDELRGAELLNDAVRDAIQKARRRGAVVTLFYEGGLDDVDEARREVIRDELASVLTDADADRWIIRAGRDPLVAVTVVGRGGASDDDAVDVWREIPRSAQE